MSAQAPPPAKPVDADWVHTTLEALGRARADEAAFVTRVEALVAAEASGDRFVRAVEARIPPPARRRRWLAWPLVLAPVALIAVLVAARWIAGPRLPHPPTAAAPAEPPPGAVVVLGTVAIADGGGQRLASGQIAPEGTTVTSDQGRACLRFNDGRRLCLEHGSRLHLAAGSADARRVVLERGKAAASVGRRPTESAFTIDTPVAELTTPGGGISVELGDEGRAAIARVVTGAAVLRPRAAGPSVALKAHEAHATAAGAPWRMSAEDEREEWSLLRGQTAAALLAASTTDGEPAPSRAPPPAPGAATAPDTEALLALADALRARGRLHDAQGIGEELARLHPGRADIIRLDAELRAPPPPSRWGATPAVYRINAGGGRYVDPRGNVWSADAHFSGGHTGEFWDEIDGTDMDPLYRSERFAFPDDTLAYRLPVANGDYVVRLHFAEIWAGTLKRDMRKFDVLIEGEQVLAAYDISADVGPMTATVKQVVTSVRDGRLDIDFQHVIENPKISGIEVFALPPGASPPPPPAPPAVYPPLPLPPTDALYRVNVGGREYVDPQGRRWEADRYFTDRGLGNAFNVDITRTTLDPLYQNGRYACGSRRLSYRFPVPAGRYMVRLHFAELEADAFPGSWQFGVSVEGAEVIKSLDVFAEAGLRTALVKEIEAQVDDGALDLWLSPSRRCAQVSAIEIVQLPGE